MKRFFLILSTAVTFVAAGALMSPAHAGLFDDDEARKAISDLNARLTAVSSKLDDQAEKKADKTAVLDQLNQLDSLRSEIAKLRGQLEVLGNSVDEMQRRQKEFYVDLDNRLRKLEPQKVVLDGKEAQVDQNEQKKL